MAFPEGWNRFSQVTIPYTACVIDMTNMPVMLTERSLPEEMLDRNGQYRCNLNGSDIRFTSNADGSMQLPAYVEKVNLNDNPSFSDCTVYVNCPSLSCSQDTVIYVWYNNPSANFEPDNGLYGKTKAMRSSFRGTTDHPVCKPLQW